MTALVTSFMTALLIALATTALPATAQVPRNFPTNALRGDMLVTQPPALLLNGRPAYLSPGARIHGQSNLLQVSGALVGGHHAVHYVLNGEGQVAELWVLTPAEFARRPWPETPEQAATWRFEPVSQTWRRP